MIEEIKKAEKAVANREANLKEISYWYYKQYHTQKEKRYTRDDMLDAEDSLKVAKIKLEELKVLYEYTVGKNTQEKGAMPKRDGSQVSHSHSS
jgi:hypothetical protein